MCPRVDLFIEFDNLSGFVDDNRYATAQTVWFVRRTEEQTDVASCIHKQWKVKIVFFSKLLMRCCILYANCKDLRIVFGKCTRLIPERADFCRSAAGEIFGIKRQHDVLLPFKAAELIGVAILIGSDEIRCRLPDLNWSRNTFID